MSNEVLVYATTSRGQLMRSLLGAACQATGLSARLELYASGSLYQRLGPRHAPPLPDVVVWSGPFAAHAAGLDGLLQSHQPARVADSAAHDPSWRWTTLDYQPVGVAGPPLAGVADLPSVATMGMADPERSEVGMSVLLAMLDRARQVESDAERAWAYWQQRSQAGLMLAEDDAGAVDLVNGGKVSHALSLSATAAPLSGLAPIPNAVGLAASSRNVEAARQLLDWLTGESSGASMAWSPWQMESNGLQALVRAAPPLDVAWGREQYAAARHRWSQSGFGPSVRE